MKGLNERKPHGSLRCDINESPPIGICRGINDHHHHHHHVVDAATADSMVSDVFFNPFLMRHRLFPLFSNIEHQKREKSTLSPLVRLILVSWRQLPMNGRPKYTYATHGLRERGNFRGK